MYEAIHKDLLLKIVEDYPEVGAYLYVYKDGTCVADHLQNDVEMCKEQALEDYGVPLSAWN